ncbi:MAG: rhomboid family intramembrane serine protease [Spirochaetaceae bacterium]|jgi:rhomboid protease GluP|nr:rhomboid family intramembrane serine protease [Spirochaetaceae bacterium]
MRLKYNAPVTLTFALICTAIVAANQYLVPGLIDGLFTAEGSLTFKYNDIPAYTRVFSYPFGHLGWEHLLSNMTLILLLGPILEERFGSRALIMMMFLTAVINGLINAFFFPTELVGSSGLVFMMIVLTSFNNIKKGEIPLTFLVIISLYMAREIFAAFKYDDISQISHIIGGTCGSMFGFASQVLKDLERKNKQAAASPGGNPSSNQTIVM